MKNLQFISSILALMLGLVPTIAYADNQGNIAYLFFIWPLGIFFIIALIVLSVLTALKLKRGEYSVKTKAWGSQYIITATILAIAYPLISYFIADSYKIHFEGSIKIIIPIILCAIICTVLNFLLYRRSK